MKFAMTIKEFCDSHSLGPTTFHKMQLEGSGPALMKVGRKVLVSTESAADWRRRMEEQSRGKFPPA